MMVEEWKEALKERSQTMLDGVAGVVIALGGLCFDVLFQWLGGASGGYCYCFPCTFSC